MIHDICRPKQLGVWRSDCVIFLQSRNVLNLCEDSKRAAAVTFRRAAQNKFIKCLRFAAAESNFPTTLLRYADKWLRKRVFFCSSGKGNPRHIAADDCAAILARVQTCNRQAALSFSVKALAFATVTIGVRRGFHYEENITRKNKSPALPGSRSLLDFGWLTLPAWQSGATGARPFGSRCSCE